MFNIFILGIGRKAGNVFMAANLGWSVSLLPHVFSLEKMYIYSRQLYEAARFLLSRSVKKIYMFLMFINLLVI